VRNVSELMGKPVISVENGDKIGTVADALIADGDVHLLALVIGGGLLGKEQVLPFRDIQTLGGDTILIRSAEGVLGPREWRDAAPPASRSSSLKGRPVVTTDGHRLGEVNDVLVDEQTGAFAALEVVTSDLGGLRSRRSIVRPGSDIRVGPDVVVVPQSAVPTGSPEEAAGRPVVGESGS
jgi:uncharacterized protein YrrD